MGGCVEKVMRSLDAARGFGAAAGTREAIAGPQEISFFAAGSAHKLPTRGAKRNQRRLPDLSENRL